MPFVCCKKAPIEPVAWIHIISQVKLGNLVILDKHGNIVETIQKSIDHNKRINCRRRSDTKIIAALDP